VTGTLALVGAWLVVGLVPGLLVVASLRPRAGVLRNLALAPLASYGLLMAVAAALAVGGVPIAPATVLPIAVGVGVGAWPTGSSSARRSCARWPP